MKRRRLSRSGKVLLPIMLALIVAVFVAPRPYDGFALAAVVILAIPVVASHTQTDEAAGRPQG